MTDSVPRSPPGHKDRKARAGMREMAQLLIQICDQSPQLHPEIAERARALAQSFPEE